MPIFDTHAHYDSNGFTADRDEILSALPAAGIGLVVDPGCELESSRAALALAERYPFVYAAVGIHPSDCAGTGEAEFAALRKLCAHKNTAAAKGSLPRRRQFFARIQKVMFVDSFSTMA